MTSSSSHEEADIVITQAAGINVHKGAHVIVIAGDVDVFILLVYFYYTCNLASPVYLVPPVQEPTHIDINETTAKKQCINGAL